MPTVLILFPLLFVRRTLAVLTPNLKDYHVLLPHESLLSVCRLPEKFDTVKPA